VKRPADAGAVAKPRARARRGRDARPAGELVEGILRRYGVAGAVREHRLVTEWAAIVGPRVAARAWPDGLANGVLYVRVTNSAWMHELGFLREALAREANRVLGDPPLVKELRLHLGARRARGGADAPPDLDDLVAALAAQRRRRPAPRPPRPVPTPAERSRIDRETDAVGDDELRAILRDVRHRLGM
jgi:hypothetical protein